MLGSHNSLTFARPQNLLFYLVLPFWRNQTKNLDKQIASGVRAFDIRFISDGKAGWKSAHGAVNLNIDPYDVIKELSEKCPEAYIRCILEKGGVAERQYFIDLCQHLEKAFPNLNFFEGIFKPTWTRIYDFKNPLAKELQTTSIQHYGSHHAWWKGAIPRIWWFLHRKDEIKEKDSPNLPIVFEDFI